MEYCITIVLSLVLLRAMSAASSPANLEQIIHPPVEAGDGRTPLYFSLIQSFSGQYISAYSLVGLELALDLINDDPTLLPGYSLHYVFTDAPCDKRDALNAFHHQVFKPPTKIGIIGSGCSVSTEPTATISHYYNLVQVSCIATSPAFKDRLLFPRYFQLLPTDDTLAAPYYGVIRHYGWKRVALLVQDENLFTVAMTTLKVLLEEGNIEYREKQLAINSSGLIVGLSEKTFDEDSRIFIISAYEPLARQIICEAYRLNYTYPRYVFITIAWYVDRWWTFQPDEYGCTPEQRATVVEFSLSVLNLPFAKYRQREQETDTGVTVGEYFHLVDTEYLNRPPLNLTLYDDVAPVCYDAMWTLALALNNTIADLESNATLSDLARGLNVSEMSNAMLGDPGSGLSISEMSNSTNQILTPPFRIEDFSYDNDVVMQTLYDHLQNTRFQGVSGSVTFDSNGIRDVTDSLTVLQFRANNKSGDLEGVVIGHVTSDYSLVYANGESDSTTWPLGIPYDGATVNEEVLSVDVALTVVLIFLSCAGIVFSIICLLFNFYFRQQTLVRLTSPNLNYLIGSGAILLYLAIIVTVLPAKSAVFAGVLCNLRVWLTGFGYSLCYGTILVKMWRVYYIFSNPFAQRIMEPRDWILALMVVFLIMLDLVLLVVFSVVEWEREDLDAFRVLDQEHAATLEGEQARVREYYVYICDSHARDIFLGAFYGYKTFLQVVGLFLAFATRKVKIKGLNDAKWIAATIYITSIVLVITILATYTLNERNNTYAAVFSSGFFIGTTFIMAFVFVSKMCSVYKDPKGRRVFDKARTKDVSEPSRKGISCDGKSTQVVENLMTYEEGAQKQLKFEDKAIQTGIE